jgi:hypothetical protein
VTGLELAARRARLGYDLDRLAELFNAHVDEVRGWETISGALPRSLSRRLDWLLANAERMPAMERSGLPPCAWADAQVRGLDSKDVATVTRVVEELKRHEATCETCQRRLAFADTLPPLPPMPLPPLAQAVLTVSGAIRRLPAWLRPAATGGLLFGVMTIFRAGFMLLFQRGTQALQAVIAVGVAVGIGAYAGAVGGLTYALVKKPAARLGAFRPYVIGIACVWACLLAFGIPLAIFTTEQFFRSALGWAFLAIAGGVLGGVLGRSWFRTPAA